MADAELKIVFLEEGGGHAPAAPPVPPSASSPGPVDSPGRPAFPADTNGPSPTAQPPLSGAPAPRQPRTGSDDASLMGDIANVGSALGLDLLAQSKKLADVYERGYGSLIRILERVEIIGRKAEDIKPEEKKRRDDDSGGGGGGGREKLPRRRAPASTSEKPADTSADPDGLSQTEADELFREFGLTPDQVGMKGPKPRAEFPARPVGQPPARPIPQGVTPPGPPPVGGASPPGVAPPLPGAAAAAPTAGATAAGAEGATAASALAVSAGAAAVALAAVAAIAALVVIGIKKLSDIIHEEAAKIEGYSADVSKAQGENEVRQILAMQRRADAIGPDVANVERDRGRFEEAMAENWTQILRVLIQLYEVVRPGVEFATDALNLNAAMLNQIIANVNDWRNALGDEAKEDKAVADAQLRVLKAMKAFWEDGDDGAGEDMFLLQLEAVKNQLSMGIGGPAGGRRGHAAPGGRPARQRRGGQHPGGGGPDRALFPLL